MTAAAQYAGHIYTATPGPPRYRRAGVAVGHTYPEGSVRRILVEGQHIASGDSGGPLYWTNPANGLLYVAGVAQQTHGLGGRYTVTFSPSVVEDGLPMPNMAAWLRYHTGVAPPP